MTLDNPLLETELNPAQLEAVTATDGPLLVVAGAGSGKTRVLTHRIAHLIRDQGVSPYEILAITFTNKAANEMRERVADLVGGVVDSMWVSTFHRACVRILRREATRLGYNASFSIYDEIDSRRLVKYCVSDLDLDPKRFPPRGIKAAISNAKNELIDYESFAQQDGRLLSREGRRRLSAVSAAPAGGVRHGLRRSVDGDGRDASAPFPTCWPNIRSGFGTCSLTSTRTRTTRSTAGEAARTQHHNVCVVGDSDQSIYAFRGADIRNILEFERDYPDARGRPRPELPINPEHPRRRKRGDLKQLGRKPSTCGPTGGTGNLLVRYQAQDERDEAAFVAEEIENYG